MKQIKFTKLSKTAIEPKKAHKTDAAYDLYADETVILDFGETVAIKTNIAIELPEGYYADIRGRSGLTLKTGIRVHLGTIDAGYRDGIGIITQNCKLSEHADFLLNAIPFYTKEMKPDELMKTSLELIERRKDLHITINKGDRIAQLLIQKMPEVELIEGTLTDSERGQKGFGSTGTR